MSLVQQLSPHGLSLHGQQYMLDGDLLIGRWVTTMVVNPNTGAAVQTGVPVQEIFPHYSTTNDLVWELVRRNSFPEALSRFESFFAWDDEETALRFMTEFKINDAEIFSVREDLKFGGNMLWLKLEYSAAEAWYNTQQYWSGTTREDRCWENLLSFPVQVLAEV